MRKLFILCFIEISMVGVVFANRYYESYKMIHNDGYDFNASTEYCINKLKANGYVISLNFEQIGNRKEHVMSLSVKTLEKFKTIQITNMLFITENDVKSITINSQVTPFVESIEFGEKEIYVTYIEFSNLRLDKLFNNTKNSFPVELKVKGKLDSKEFEEDFKYIAEKYQRKKTAPDWLYRLFPGM